jgi:hypothetical protein
MAALILLIGLPVWSGTFRDDFEDGDLDGWQQIWPNPEKGIVWKVVDGELECVRMSQWSAGLVTGDSTWTDYTIEVDAKLLQYHGPGDFDLVARAGSNDDGYAFLVGDWVGQPSVYVQKFPELGMEVTMPFDELEMNVWHHLKLEVGGRDFTFWINNKWIVEYQDNTYKSGMVGFGVANNTIRFDNVVITGPDVPNVTPPTWGVKRAINPKNMLAVTWGGIKTNQ